MILILFSLLLTMAFFALLCVFRYGESGSNERRNIRILIEQLLDKGYLPQQITKILSVYD
jgi:hypothetical protein